MSIVNEALKKAARIRGRMAPQQKRFTFSDRTIGVKEASFSSA